MKVRIAPLKPDHVDEVLAIEELCFQKPWKRDAFLFEILLNELAEYVVAVCQKHVIGYGGMWLILDEAHVTNIAVHPDFRGRKVGQRILSDLIRRATGKGTNGMTLEVRPSNLIARKLYKNAGFEEKGLRKRYYEDNNEDAIIMWLEDLQTSAEE